MFSQFIREKSGSLASAQHVWRVIIFLMTVSSGKEKMDQIRGAQTRRLSLVFFGCSRKDLFRDMFYVKALDIPEKETRERGKVRPAPEWRGKSQKNNKQHPNKCIQLSITSFFYGTKLGLWVRGSFF
jgi:hypothetical protein